MKLFYAPGSSSLLPHIVLYEAGLPFAAVRIDEHTKIIESGGDYRMVNPLGYVPALVLDDGTLLTEGAAIVQYIADQVPSKNLAPPNGTIERTKLQAWLNFFSRASVGSRTAAEREAQQQQPSRSERRYLLIDIRNTHACSFHKHCGPIMTISRGPMWFLITPVHQMVPST